MKIKDAVISLDKTDLHILRALEEDARKSYAEIGKQLGIAHSTVYDRIRKMEQQRIIKGYTTRTNTERAGIRSITAIMTIYADPKETEAVAQKLSKFPQTLEVSTSLSEELIIIVKVEAPDQESLHEFIANSVAPLSGVLRIRTSIVTKKFKETPSSIENKTRSQDL